MLRRQTLKRVGWFIALWVLSVAALGAVAYLIRLAIH